MNKIIINRVLHLLTFKMPLESYFLRYKMT